MRPLAVLAVALLTPLAAAQAASTPLLTVDGAASLTEVFPRIDASERYEFAGSDQLALQIAQGQPADVFAAASPRYPEQLYAQGLVEKPVVFATNTVVLIVPKRNPAGIRSVYDVAKPGAATPQDGHRQTANLRIGVVQRLFFSIAVDGPRRDEGRGAGNCRLQEAGRQSEEHLDTFYVFPRKNGYRSNWRGRSLSDA